MSRFVLELVAALEAAVPAAYKDKPIRDNLRITTLHTHKVHNEALEDTAAPGLLITVSPHTRR